MLSLVIFFQLKMPPLIMPSKFLLYGDSITQRAFAVETRGWVAQLANAYVRHADIINRGLSGYNSEWCLKVAPQILNEYSHLELTIVFIGVNDCYLPINPQQHVPLDRYRRNLAEILAIAKTKGRVLVLCPTFVDIDAWERQRISVGKVLDRSVDFTKQYHDACYEVATECACASVKTWTYFVDASQEDMFTDGLHLSSSGNDLMFKLITDAIENNWPELKPDLMRTFLPLSGTVDPNNLDMLFE